MKLHSGTTLLMFLALSVWLTGCGSKDDGFQEYSAADKTEADPHDHHDHGEHAHGPHDGHLTELGEDHKFMAEVVFNAGEHAVGVYILDHDKLEPVAIEATEISAHLHIDEKEAEYKLAAKPQEGDAEGKSSFFELAGNEVIAEHITDIEDIEGEVMITISGKEYEGVIGHGHDDHDHGDHGHGDHGHGDHDHGDHKHGDGDKDHKDHDHGDEEKKS